MARQGNGWRRGSRGSGSSAWKSPSMGPAWIPWSHQAMVHMQVKTFLWTLPNCFALVCHLKNLGWSWLDWIFWKHCVFWNEGTLRWVSHQLEVRSANTNGYIWENIVTKGRENFVLPAWIACDIQPEKKVGPKHKKKCGCNLHSSNAHVRCKYKLLPQIEACNIVIEPQTTQMTSKIGDQQLMMSPDIHVDHVMEFDWFLYFPLLWPLRWLGWHNGGDTYLGEISRGFSLNLKELKQKKCSGMRKSGSTKAVCYVSESRGHRRTPSDGCFR